MGYSIWNIIKLFLPYNYPPIRKISINGSSVISPLDALYA
jgi:hypothetical protein